MRGGFAAVRHGGRPEPYRFRVEALNPKPCKAIDAGVSGGPIRIAVSSLLLVRLDAGGGVGGCCLPGDLVCNLGFRALGLGLRGKCLPYYVGPRRKNNGCGVEVYLCVLGYFKASYVHVSIF